MICTKKYIVLFLLGIFLFPILFQSIHIVYHHKHEHGFENQTINKSFSENDVCLTTTDALLHQNECIICDYQFSINDLPDTAVFRTISSKIISLLDEKIINPYYHQNFSKKTPRAPPFPI